PDEHRNARAKRCLGGIRERLQILRRDIRHDAADEADAADLLAFLSLARPAAKRELLTKLRNFALQPALLVEQGLEAASRFRRAGLEAGGDLPQTPILFIKVMTGGVTRQRLNSPDSRSDSIV